MSTRINSRTVKIPNNDIYLINYTRSGKDSNGQTKLKCMLIKTCNGERVSPDKIFKFILCPNGSEEDWRNAVTEKATDIADDLFSKLLLNCPSEADISISGLNKSPAPTFGEYFEKAHVNIEAYYCWEPSTIQQYYSNIKKKLAPLLSDKPMYQLDYKDYDYAVDINRLTRIFTKLKDLGQDRIDQFWSNLFCVAEHAKNNDICAANPIPPKKQLNAIKSLIRDHQKRKSINPKEATELVSLITENMSTDPTSMAIGTALQLFLGMRTAEACGLNFRDIHAFKAGPSRCYLDCYKQNRGNTSQEFNHYSAQLKTQNAYRYIPLPKELQILIEYTRDLLHEFGFSNAEIDNMPIVSAAFSGKEKKTPARIKKRVKTRCASSDLGVAGGNLLQQILKSYAFVGVPFDNDQQYTSENEIDDSSISQKKFWKQIESDTSSYITRRNLVTNLFGICGMSDLYEQYIIGHALDDINRSASDLTCEEVLMKIMKQMDRMIYVPDKGCGFNNELLKKLARPDPRKAIQNIVCFGEEKITIDDEVGCRYHIEPGSSEEYLEITIVLEAEEPMDKPSIKFHSNDEVEYTVMVSDTVHSAPSPTANVLSYYYDSIFTDQADSGKENNDEIAVDDDFEEEKMADMIKAQTENYEKNIDAAADEPLESEKSVEEDNDED